MTLSAGTRLGPYELVAPVGAGGMGEVYRARDTRLERTVAVKVLPAHLSSSAESRQRFEREAKTISQLSHPHICALYDVGREGETEYLVMEYLEGETLSERLLKGALPFDQVLRYGIEISDALDKAHRQGIVHRDLKPGNVMLTKSGVKLLDFGLAKAMAPASPTQLTSFPTQAALTQEGTILGTFQYMAPEQLEGTEADARTDIFAFGAVLYEMTTGQKAFSGKTQASLIAAIIERVPPPISTISPMMPPAFDRVVKTCLAKDPEDRWQTAHDVMLELKWVAEGGSAVGLPAPVVAKRKTRERLAWIVATAAIATAALFASLHFGASEKSESLIASLLPPEKTFFDPLGGPMAFSPDGRQIALVVRPVEGQRSLWIRPLDAPEARPVTGTEGAAFPFWSPDGRWIGFFADGKLKKLELRGETPETLCDAPASSGASWNQHGDILFGPMVGRTPLYRISENGGSPVPATRLEGDDVRHYSPAFLPDGKHFLFLVSGSVSSERDRIFVGSLDNKQRRQIAESNSGAIYSPTGHILFWTDGALRALAFDAKRLRAIGRPISVASDVRYDSFSRAAFSSVSSSGLLAFQRGTSVNLSRLVWFDRQGKEIGSVGSPARYFSPRLSHDGRRIAVDMSDLQNNGDLWLIDLGRAVATRFTFDPADESAPVWSPDDMQIVFFSYRGATTRNLHQKAANGVSSDRPLFVSSAAKWPTGWSSDGRLLLFTSQDPARPTADIWVFSFRDGKASRWLATPFNEVDPQFSPNGEWVAYSSDESGRSEVYVQPFRDSGGKWQVSTLGGSMPAWRRDGKELFYVDSAGNLMSVPVRITSTFEAGAPSRLFPTRFGKHLYRQYDVSPDGQRFLLNAIVEEATPTPITLVLNWQEKLSKR